MNEETNIVVPVDPREMTSIISKAGEEIHIIHEITLGDLLISTLLLCILIFLLISKFIGGSRDV